MFHKIRRGYLKSKFKFIFPSFSKEKYNIPKIKTSILNSHILDFIFDHKSAYNLQNKQEWRKSNKLKHQGLVHVDITLQKY